MHCSVGSRYDGGCGGFVFRNCSSRKPFVCENNADYRMFDEPCPTTTSTATTTTTTTTTLAMERTAIVLAELHAACERDCGEAGNTDGLFTCRADQHRYGTRSATESLRQTG